MNVIKLNNNFERWFMKKLGIVVLLLSLITIGNCADGFYFKQKNTIGGKITESEQIISSDLLKSEDGNGITIITSKDISFFDKIAKTYYTQSLDQMSELAMLADAQFAGFELKKTGKKSLVGKWETEIYQANFNLMGMSAEADIYVCKNNDIPSDLMFKLPAKMYPQAKNIQNMLKKLQSTGGFQVKSVTKIMGTEVIAELLDVNKIDVTENMFKGPEGYKQVDPPENPMQDMMK